MLVEWNVEGKRILITGAAAGLGAAYTEAFLKNGAKNVAVLDVAEEAGKAFVDKLNEDYKDKVIFIKCDVSKEHEIQNAFDQVVKSFQGIDLLVNNAGIMNDASHVWRTASDVNWQGLVSFTMKGIEHMRQDTGGSGGTIVNVSSAAALGKLPFLPAYCGTKAAVLHFGQCIASPEFNNTTGIRLLTICFGATNTALLECIEKKTFDEELGKKMLAVFPPFIGQEIESAVAGMLTMIREGAPGSIWLSINDKPVRDITPIIDGAFKEFEKLLLPDGVKDFTELMEMYNQMKK